jgi:hypothetical protein
LNFHQYWWTPRRPWCRFNVRTSAHRWKLLERKSLVTSLNSRENTLAACPPQKLTACTVAAEQTRAQAHAGSPALLHWNSSLYFLSPSFDILSSRLYTSREKEQVEKMLWHFFVLRLGALNKKKLTVRKMYNL